MDKYLYGVIIAIALAAAACGPRTGSLRDAAATLPVRLDVPESAATTAAAPHDPEIFTSIGDGDPAGRWVLFDFTAAQLEEFERQVQENRKTGVSTVTITLTAEQLEAVKRVNPAWTATAVTVDAGRVIANRLNLRFDEQGDLIKEARPYTSR
jgi:hypothetical protein